MNRHLLIDQDSNSDYSFDSSQIPSSPSRTASIDSIIDTKQNQISFHTPSHKNKSQADQNLSQRTASIQKPRIAIHYEQQQFQQEPQFQLGFVVGKGKKNVFLQQSKMKKVKNFFDDDDETTFNSNLFPNHSLFQFPNKQRIRQKKEQIPQLSIPCFGKYGKNKKLQIDQNLIQKGKNFFNDQFDNLTFPILPSKQKNKIQQKQGETKEPISFRKPTKIKKNNSRVEQNLIKTVNYNKKPGKQVKKVIKKQAFDWNKFELRQNSSIKKQKKLMNEQLIFKFIKLQDLNGQILQNQQKIQEFKDNKIGLKNITFVHENIKCRILKCLLCNLKLQQQEINVQFLEKVFTKKLITQKLDQELFIKLYDIATEKLLKYSIFYPQILNKQLNPNNILVQIHKKTKVLQSNPNFFGWMDYCIKQKKHFHSFIVQVKQIYHNDERNTFYVHVTDGWSNLWIVVSDKNCLYKFILKLKLFSRLFISHWRFYGLNNILSFCPLAKQEEKAIQIYYNSSIIVQHHIKLGKPKSLIFYRPLNLNKKQGGIIPTVQGTIIRMFCSSQSKQKSSFVRNQQNNFNQNFLQILTPQNFTVLIKFILPNDRSLAELFRLYFKYQFYFLKIGYIDSMLTFNDEISKFYEFNKKDKNVYEDNLIELLRQRYINGMNDKKITNLKVGNLYDMRLDGTQGFINGFKIIIQSQNQTENTNSFIKSGACLYQQYELDRIQKQIEGKECQKLVYYFKKGRFSNSLKSIPSIYQKICKLN